MIRNTIKSELKRVLDKAGYKDIEPQILPTTDPRFGDYYTPIALKLAKASKQQTPVETANFFEAKLQKNEEIFTTEVASNGFINFRISPSYLRTGIQKILEEGEGFGRSEMGKRKKVRVEFVSANPTGPLHIGNARGGPLGDSLANILEFSGFEVLREYLNNDTGGQVETLGATIAYKSGYYREALPEKGKELAYKGTYIEELAKKVKSQLDSEGGEAKYGMLSSLEQERLFGSKAARIMFEEIINELQDMGIKYDYIVHESDLQKKLPQVLKLLDKKGLLKKHEGATWFASKNEFLKDRDAVVVKSDGSYTYFASDIVYHKEKFASGAGLVIDVFGSNTSGHVPKLQAAVTALGFDAKKLKIVLYQFVRVKKGKKIVKMSKRAGNYVTAREVLDEVGRDAFRFNLLMYDPNTHIDFNLLTVKKQSEENPVYYVQYAHARANGILKEGQKESIQLQNASKASTYLLKQPAEIALLRQLAKFPELLEDITGNLAVHLLPQYCRELADSFHRFYEQVRVISDDKNTSQARLALVQAVRIVLRNSLKLMGVSAPERMERVNAK